VLVFGMMVFGCEEEKSKPYPQSIMIQVGNSSWTSTSGSVEIMFLPPVPVVQNNLTYTGTPAKISVQDLQWLQTSGINLELFNANSRTLTITTIEKTEWDDKAAVKLNLTRSAVPSSGSGTATVLITLPNDFTAKYPDGITWGNKAFDF